MEGSCVEIEENRGEIVPFCVEIEGYGGGRVLPLPGVEVEGNRGGGVPPPGIEIESH